MAWAWIFEMTRFWVSQLAEGLLQCANYQKFRSTTRLQVWTNQVPLRALVVCMVVDDVSLVWYSWKMDHLIWQ